MAIPLKNVIDATGHPRKSWHVAPYKKKKEKKEKENEVTSRPQKWKLNPNHILERPQNKGATNGIAKMDKKSFEELLELL